MERAWVVTASADHAERGRQEGIVQACHGRASPLRRMAPGDGVVIYSPRSAFAGGAPLQAFTAIGHVRDARLWQHDMEGGFTPWRRAVVWAGAVPAPIHPLLDRLDLTRGLPSWGIAFRFGLCALGPADFALIAGQMTADFIRPKPFTAA